MGSGKKSHQQTQGKPVLPLLATGSYCEVMQTYYQTQRMCKGGTWLPGL